MPSFLRWLDQIRTEISEARRVVVSGGRKNESIGGTDVDHGNLWKPDLYRIGRRDGRASGVDRPVANDRGTRESVNAQPRSLPAVPAEIQNDLC